VKILIFEQLAFIRKGTIKVIESTEESHLTIIPQGFNNHILWNYGHIFVIQERMVFPAMREPSELNEILLQLFNNKTSPANWSINPPPLNEITQLLSAQTTRIQESFKNRLDEKLVEPFTLFKSLTFNTMRDILTFTIFHEGMHLETMKMYRRILLENQK
jgi:hypothetical protein